MLGRLSRRTGRQLEDRGRVAQATVVEVDVAADAFTDGSPGVSANTTVVRPAGPRGQVRFDPDDHAAIDLVDTWAGLKAEGQTLSSLLAAVQQARAAGDGENPTVAEALRAAFAGQGRLVVGAHQLVQTSAVPDHIADERLVKVRDSRTVDRAESDTQKQRLLDVGL